MDSQAVDGGATVIEGAEADQLVRALRLMPWGLTLKGMIVMSHCSRLYGSLCWCSVVFVMQWPVGKL